MSERKDAIKAKQQAQRDAIKAKARRKRAIIQASIAVAVVAIAVVITLIVSTTTSGIASAVGTPANLANGGVRFTSSNLIPDQSAASKSFQIATQPLDTKKVDVRVYIDYQCPFCNEFEEGYGDYLKGLVKKNEITLEYHPIAILDRESEGTNYSTRAAASSACVAALSPAEWIEYNQILYQNQPAETTKGLTNAKLIQLAKKAKVTDFSKVSSCILKQKYSGWVTNNTNSALKSVPFLKAGLTQTPTIMVDGKQFTSTTETFSDYLNNLIAKKLTTGN